MWQVFRSIARALRRTRSDQYPAAERASITPARGIVPGMHMTPEEALRLSAVWACVTVIAKAIAGSPWDVFNEDAAGNRVPRRESRVWQLLNLRPNPEMTPFAFRESLLVVAQVWGNAYCEIEWDGAGRPYALWPLDPVRTQRGLIRDQDGHLVLPVTNWGKPDTILDYQDVFHLQGPSIDGIAGYDVVLMALRCLSQMAAVERFTNAFYANGTAFGGVLSTDQNLGKDRREDIRDSINNVHQGVDKAFKFLILEGGLKFDKLAPTAAESQDIERRHFLIEEVCRWFGVPPHKVQHLVRATFNNIEHLGLEFVRDALTPWAERLRQEADWKLIPSGGRLRRSRIDLDWLAEGDALSKARTDAALVQNGLMTRNEARRRRGLNTIGADGDVLTVQTNLTTLDRVGEEPEPSAPGREGNLDDEGGDDGSGDRDGQTDDGGTRP